MKKLVLLCVLLLATGASAAQAALHLAWTDCGGATNLDDACTSNTGSFDIVASFDAPAGSTAITGEQGVIDVQVDGGAVPPWWQAVVTGSCRGSAVSVMYTNPGNSCADYFNTVGVPLGGIGYDYYPVSPTIAPGRVRIRTVSSIATPAATSFENAGIAAGTNTYLLTIRVKMTKTVGAGACAGCDLAACWVLQNLLVTQPAGVGDYFFLTTDGSGAYVEWQGGAVGAGPFGSGCPGATPAARTSWGQLKGLYR